MVSRDVLALNPNFSEVQKKIPLERAQRHSKRLKGQKSGGGAGSTLERRFDTLWRQFAPASMPAPITEFQALPPRRWRIDRSWPLLKVAVELEGGVWSGGRHTRGSGFTLDCEKYNALTAESWLILRFTSDMLRDDPEGCIALVVDVLETRQRQQAMPRGAAAATGGADEVGSQCGA